MQAGRCAHHEERNTSESNRIRELEARRSLLRVAVVVGVSGNGGPVLKRGGG